MQAHVRILGQSLRAPAGTGTCGKGTGGKGTGGKGTGGKGTALRTRGGFALIARY
jgi:hypothetical protein